DATRVASYNPWTALYWLVSGRTVGGMQMYDHSARLDRDTALMLWTQGSAWFSSEQNQKGQIKVGQLADLAVLSKDYFRVPEEEIKGIDATRVASYNPWTALYWLVSGRTVGGMQ
ncbi:amidohydrolase family protein, partial [Enterobacter hormaechei]|uniref:amidohydrolase family protein n=1 Tax=Enterobacter hormaechei TaxID=158836 RepID=UPI001F2191AB